MKTFKIFAFFVFKPKVLFEHHNFNVFFKEYFVEDLQISRLIATLTYISNLLLQLHNGNDYFQNISFLKLRQ